MAGLDDLAGKFDFAGKFDLDGLNAGVSAASASATGSFSAHALASMFSVGGSVEEKQLAAQEEIARNTGVSAKNSKKDRTYG